MIDDVRPRDVLAFPRLDASDSLRRWLGPAIATSGGGPLRL